MSLDEKSQKLGEMLAQVRNGFQGAIEAIDAFLNYLGKPSEPVDEKPYDKLFWEKRNGAKGPFEMTTAKANQNSDLFRHLQAVLKQNKRRFTEKSWIHYYWLGQNDDDTLFRREKRSRVEQAPGGQK